MILTAEQRYKQAVRKVQIRRARSVRLFIAGKIGMLECGGEREALIDAIDRAYRDGFAAGQSPLPTDKVA